MSNGQSYPVGPIEMTPEGVVKSTTTPQGDAYRQPGVPVTPGATVPQGSLFAPNVDPTGYGRLTTAGEVGRGVYTGLPKEVEAAYSLAQQALTGAQPSLYGPGGIIERGEELAATTRGAIPGIQQWMQQQAGMFGPLQQQQLGQVAAGQSAVQQALSQLAGLQGGAGAQAAEQALLRSGLQITPEMEEEINRRRELATNRALLAAGFTPEGAIAEQGGLSRQLSQLQALAAGRGLGGTTIAGRQQAERIMGAQQQAEQARIAAEEQALQERTAARALGLQERGQTVEGALGLMTGRGGLAGQAGQLGLGLGQQGLAGTELATGLLGQVSPMAQTQAQLGLLGQALGLERGLRQEQITPELQALQIALGAPIQPSGPGLGEVLGGLAGTALGATGTALSGSKLFG